MTGMNKKLIPVATGLKIPRKLVSLLWGSKCRTEHCFMKVGQSIIFLASEVLEEHQFIFIYTIFLAWMVTLAALTSGLLKKRRSEVYSTLPPMYRSLSSIEPTPNETNQSLEIFYTYFHNFPSDLLSSEFCKLGYCLDMTRRAA